MSVEIMFTDTTQCFLTIYLHNNQILKWHIDVFLDRVACVMSVSCQMDALPRLHNNTTSKLFSPFPQSLIAHYYWSFLSLFVHDRQQ